MKSMVTLDREKMVSFQKPYRPTSSSKSLVITLPKLFTDILGITASTRLVVTMSQTEHSMTIELEEKRLNQK